MPARRDDTPRASAPPRRLVLLGHPVAHSLSPSFQNAALRAAQIDCAYVALDVAPVALDETLAALRDAGCAGNVTIPHKEAVAARADRLSERARRAGAVNTFWFDDGALVGHNTDVAGIIQALRHLDATIGRGVRCALLGAGGSAAATLVALDELGATDVRLWSRTPTRAETLAQTVTMGAGARVQVVADAHEACEGAALVINATPVGMRDDAHPVPVERLDANAMVLDLVYRRGETAWVRACRAAGLHAQDGLRMLVEQGAAAFESWFGIDPDRSAMWAVLEPRA